MKIRMLALALGALVSFMANAQSFTNKAYAITSKTYGAYDWTEVKEVSLVNGEVTRNIFSNNSLYNLFDGRTSKIITTTNPSDTATSNSLHPFSGLSAACAFDAKLNRLYYTPIFINELRYIDLNAGIPHIYVFRNETFSRAEDVDLEANQMTRMVIAADGNGYAMSNDGRHLVMFTTENKPVITDLGSVHDSPENGEMSIRDANTSWGGDMLADASGNLYVITAYNHVFKIDILTRTAKYISKIKGLPEGFTTNGAVVNEEGFVVVSSANYLTAYYAVDPQTWQSTTVEGKEQIYNTSDLANNNLLYKTNFVKEENISLKENITVYPNPVRSKFFRVNFENQKAGKYNIQLVDVLGRLVSDRVVSVSTGSQVSEVRIEGGLTKGMYFVKILNNLDKEIYTRKIMVE